MAEIDELKSEMAELAADLRNALGQASTIARENERLRAALTHFRAAAMAFTNEQAKDGLK